MTEPVELTYICMIPTRNTGRTWIWEVVTKDDSEKEAHGGLFLGEVKWFGRWRGYAFFPRDCGFTAFEHRCLREIADFIESRTKEHLAKKRPKKKAKRKATKKRGKK